MTPECPIRAQFVDSVCNLPDWDYYNKDRIKSNALIERQTSLYSIQYICTYLKLFYLILARASSVNRTLVANSSRKLAIKREKTSQFKPNSCIPTCGGTKKGNPLGVTHLVCVMPSQFHDFSALISYFLFQFSKHF